jgi:hypothetical protein
MLVRCLYASRTSAQNSAEVLNSILQQSRNNNLERGITGILCFTGDIFIQVIEGGRDQVCELFNSIVRDNRHHDLRILIYEEISERRFGKWAMANVSIETINSTLLLKYFEKAKLNPFACSGLATMSLFDELVATGSILSMLR